MYFTMRSQLRKTRSAKPGKHFSRQSRIQGKPSSLLMNLLPPYSPATNHVYQFNRNMRKKGGIGHLPLF